MLPMRSPILAAAAPASHLATKRRTSSTGAAPAAPPASRPPFLGISSVPTPAKVLGLAGLIPFVGTAAAAIHMPEAVMLISETQAAYGCAILSFMGAVHWGLAMAHFGGSASLTTRYVLSTAPALLGFFTLALVPHVPIRLIVEAIGFTGLLAGDLIAHHRGLVPPWYFALRLLLTSIVVASLGVTVYVAWSR